MKKEATPIKKNLTPEKQLKRLSVDDADKSSPNQLSFEDQDKIRRATTVLPEDKPKAPVVRYSNELTADAEGASEELKSNHS